MKGFKQSLLAFTLCATTASTFALAATPSATLMGMGGENFSAWADGMLPLYANENKIAYIDAQGQGSDTNAGMFSLGAGYRVAETQDNILGAYFFVDRERSSDNAYFTVLGPGVEKITPTWSYRLNGYVPIGNKKVLTSSGWASDFGYYDNVEFSGNTESDTYAYNYQKLGYGGDFSVGYHFVLDPRWEVALSPYAYRMADTNAMLGSKAQINFFTSEHSELFIGDGYDNKNHNRVFAGINISFGARTHNTDQNALMATPVYRNLNVNTTSNGIPVSDTTSYGPEQERYDNVNFVDDENGSSGGAGTYEDPYASIDQATSGSGEDTRIYVADTGTNYTSNDDITLQDGQGIYGRSDDFYAPTTGSDQATIKFTNSDGFIATSSNDFSDITIVGGGYANPSNSNTAITINENSDSNEVSQINNVNIGSTNKNTSYQTGIVMDKNSKANINNSTITGYTDRSTDDGTDAYGIYAVQAKSLTISNSTINSNANSKEGESYAIHFNNSASNNYNAKLTITDSTINAINSKLWATGIYAEGAIFKLSNSTVNATSSIEPWGILLVRATSSAIDNSNINTTSLEPSTSYGIVGFTNNGDFTLSNSTINTNDGDTAYGLDLEDFSGEINIHDNYINTAAGNDAYGINLENIGSISIKHNIFNIGSTYGKTTSLTVDGVAVNT
jgi:trimeric autotransporter adhesin